MRLPLSVLLLAVTCATSAAQSLVVDTSYLLTSLGGGFSFLTTDVSVDSQDRVVAVGTARNVGAEQRTAALYRALPEGGNDFSYGSNGRIPLPLPLLQTYAPLTAHLATVGNGIATVAGSLTLPDSTRRQPFLARYDEVGQPDSMLAPTGFRLLDIPYSAEVGAVAATESRTYLALERSAATGGGCEIAALMPSGALDPTFGTDGVAPFPTDVACMPRDLLLTPDGVLLLARLGPDSSATGVVAAFTTSGHPAVAFGNQGSYDFSVDGGALFPSTLLAWEGRIVAGGLLVEQDQTGIALVALSPNGTLDLSFNDGAGVYFASTPGETYASGLALSESHGFLVASLALRPSYYVFLFAATVFAPEGQRVVQAGADGFYIRTISDIVVTGRAYAYGVAGSGSDSTGRILVAGTQVSSGSGLTNGRLDSYTLSFETAPAPAAPALGTALTVAPNPAAGRTTVALTLAAPADATVRLVDALGRTVATLADRALPAGTTTLDVNASRLAPGVYAVVAETGTERTVARFSVVR